MDNYLVNLTSILDDLGATIEVSDEFPLESLQVGDETFVPQSPATFNIWLTHTGTSVVSGGRVVADVLATCSRCLCEFPLRIEGEVDGFYVEPGKEDGIPEDQDYEMVSAEGVVDILPSLMVALVLEAPFAPIHDEECAGLCATVRSRPQRRTVRLCRGSVRGSSLRRARRAWWRPMRGTRRRKAPPWTPRSGCSRSSADSPTHR